MAVEVFNLKLSGDFKDRWQTHVSRWKRHTRNKTDKIELQASKMLRSGFEPESLACFTLLSSKGQHDWPDYTTGAISYLREHIAKAQCVFTKTDHNDELHKYIFFWLFYKLQAMYPRCFVRSCILVLTWFSSKKIRNCSTMFPKVAAY